MQECRYWAPARPDPPAPYRTLTTPVLLLAGALDLSTPLPWAQQEAAQIPHARLVVIPDSGHATQLASAGGPAAAQQFLLDYSTSWPGCGCAGIDPSRPAW
jgi:pimeloyl-ACP methyl ester carboxylesterase